MARLLAVASRIDRLGMQPLTSLREQLDFLQSVGVAVELLVDPSFIEFELKIRRGNLDCVYLTPLRLPGELEADTRLLNHHMTLTRLLQQLGQPFIGQDFGSQLAINDKTLCAFVTECHPPGWLITRQDVHHQIHLDIVSELPDNAFPVLVKPNTLWASMGIGANAVARSRAGLASIVFDVFERFPHLGEVRVETFIENAREATVSVVGNENELVVGVTELLFAHAGLSINDEHEKTSPRSSKRVSYRGWPQDEFRLVLEYLGKELFRKFAFRDVARFDIMVREKPFVVDVNDMPFLGNAFCQDWISSYGTLPTTTRSSSLIKSSRLQRLTLDAYLPDSRVESSVKAFCANSRLRPLRL